MLVHTSFTKSILHRAMFAIPYLLFAIAILTSTASAFAPTIHISGHNVKSISSSPSPITDINFHDNKYRASILTTINYTPRGKSNNLLFSTNNDGNSEEDKKDADAKRKSINEKIFWAKQQALAAEMSTKADSSLKQEMADKFAKRRLALTSDTFYFSILISSALWIIFPNPFVTLSYMFGAISGTAYSYGLGKYVESIGGSIDDENIEGAGVGQARFAFLILLFVVVGKYRSQGLLEIPSIMGFFTYQLASLNQGLKEIDD